MTVADFVREEMEARGWSSRDVANRIVPRPNTPEREHEWAIWVGAIDMMMAVPGEGVIDDQMATALGTAFGVSPRFFLNLYRLTDGRRR